MQFNKVDIQVFLDKKARAYFPCCWFLSVCAFQNIWEKNSNMIVKQLSEICEQKILQVIINHLQIRKTIIGKWVVSLPEWLELLQVSVVKEMNKGESKVNQLTI